MYNYTLSQIAGIITLFMMVASYLVKRKSSYLLFQTVGLGFMFLSYLFGANYFAMIALTVSLSRTLVFLIYEKKDKRAPLVLGFLFATLTVLAYVAVNLVILKTARPTDILYLTAQVMYAFIFRIRSIKLVRYTIIIPHSLAILYNLLLDGMLFVALSYGFELLADLYAIVRAKLEEKKAEKALREAEQG